MLTALNKTCIVVKTGRLQPLACRTESVEFLAMPWWHHLVTQTMDNKALATDEWHSLLVWKALSDQVRHWPKMFTARFSDR